MQAHLGRLCLVVLSFLASMASGCAGNQPRATSGEEFGFLLRYGVNASNAVNTFAGTLSIQIKPDSSITVPFHFTEEQMARLKQAFAELQIFTYPDTLDPCAELSSPAQQSPYETMVLEIRLNQKKKTIYWADWCGADNARSRKLRQLINEIRTMVVESPTYQQLPRLQGGYH